MGLPHNSYHYRPNWTPLSPVTITNSLICIPYPRVKCLKTIPFTAAHTCIVHIWQYPRGFRLPPFKLIAFIFESAASESQIKPQDPKEMCLLLEHQNQSKASKKKIGYFDRVTVFITHLAILH